MNEFSWLVDATNFMLDSRGVSYWMNGLTLVSLPFVSCTEA